MTNTRTAGSSPPLPISLEVAVHPAEHRRGVVDRGILAEVPVSRLPRPDRVHAVGPGAEDQPGPRGAGTPGAHQARVVGDRADRPVRLVEPSGEIQHRGPDPVVASLERRPAPPRIARRVAHPLVVPRRDALEVRQREQGPVPARASAVPLPRGGDLGIPSADRAGRAGAGDRARCSTRSNRATSRPTRRRNTRSSPGWRRSSRAPSPSARAAAPRRRATAPRRGRRGRRCRPRRWTTAGARPTRWCRSRPSPRGDRARTRHPTRSGRARPAPRRRSRARPPGGRSPVRAPHRGHRECE